MLIIFCIVIQNFFFTNMNLVSHLKKQKTIQIISDVGDILKLEDLKEILLNNEKKFNSLGLKRSDVVAIVLDNGVEFITSFLSVINRCIAAPLNPSYSLAEYDFYYHDLQPKMVITNYYKDHPAVLCAKKNKIEIVNSKNFIFSIKKTLKKKKVKSESSPTPNDIALVLHTSGTTSRPKMVPLSHKNLLKSCENITKALKIKETDKNIILMPSFHIHGIVASILAPLYKGSKVVALPKFNVLSFYNFLDKHNPTWFTAVPTMLQSIVDRSKNNKEIIKRNKLRFIRSSSASLPAPTLSGIENIFNVPVIESYGMTEASHQMTTNLLPPNKRKIGSVGVPIGLSIRIVSSEFKTLNANQIGEVVIKGQNVISKYIADREVNANSFYKGWFKTGDLGYFDKDNCLFITGRIKEIINRGGEKISPKEIDDVFIQYFKVSKAVTFSVNHPKLGEDIALAVVIKKGMNCNPNELKEFAKDKIAPFKIPKNIYFLETIPLGATGKLQRIGLAKKLGIEK